MEDFLIPEGGPDDVPTDAPVRPSLAEWLNLVPRPAWAILALAAIVFVGGPAVVAWWRQPRYNTVILVGSDVGYLQPGAFVALDIQRIGVVDRVSLRDGQVAADLKIDRTQLRNLPSDARFSVESLNDWMPGNVGVRVRIASSGGPFEPLGDGAVVAAVGQFLPLEIPPRFYLLVGAGLLILVVALGVALALRDLIRGVFLVVGALLLTGIVFLWINGTISPAAM